MGNSFWTRGRRAYAAALRREHCEQLDELRSKLDQCDNDSQRLVVEEEIETVETEFKIKLKGNDGRLLF